MTAAVFEERSDPGRIASALLAAAVHGLLLAVLVFGVRWQNRPPESVMVELWNAPPAPVQVQPEPKPAPRVEPAPAPPPEPVIPKPDIVEKKAPEPKPAPKPLPKAEPKPPPKPVAKAEPLKPRVDETKRFQEELAREQASFQIDREREQIRDQLANDAAAARSKSIADWVSKVRAKIRGNVVLPPDIKGNPEAIFDVVQLPTGEVLSVKRRKSSGHPALDDAIERAILKSSPLPKPDKSESAPRAFELKYRPLD
jgi:colicin import membrane protein